MTNESLALSVQRGNQADFAALWAQVQRLAKMLANRYVSLVQPSDIEDLYQLAALGVWDACKTFDPLRGSFTTWMPYYIKQRIRRELLRPRVQTVSLDAPLSEDGEGTLMDVMPDDSAEDPQTIAERTDLAQRVREAVARLPDKERTIVSLYDLQGMNFQEAAQAAQAHDTTGTALTLAAQHEAWKELQSVMGAEQAQTFATAFNEYLQDNKLTYEAEVPAEWFSGTEAKLQEDLEKMDLTAPVSLQPRLGAFATVAIGSAMSAANSVLASLPGHAEGLDYVPYDNYAARLHEGEAVLTRKEAQEWRNSPADNGEILAMLRQLNENITALRGMKIVLNGHEVGEAVTETVSRNIAQNAQAGRYA